MQDNIVTVNCIRNDHEWYLINDIHFFNIISEKNKIEQLINCTRNKEK